MRSMKTLFWAIGICSLGGVMAFAQNPQADESKWNTQEHQSSVSSSKIPQTVEANWDELNRSLKQASDARERIEKSPNTPDREIRDRELLQAIYKAYAILVHSDSLDYLDQEKPKIDVAIKAEEQKIEEFENKKRTAPDEKRLLGKSKSDYDRYIEQSIAEKERLNNELLRLYEYVAKEYSPDSAPQSPRPSNGTSTSADSIVSLDQSTEVPSLASQQVPTGEDVKSFLATPLGRDILDNINVFRNVKLLTENFGERLNRSPENLTIARDYYDIYLTLLDILLVCQEDLVEVIDGKWTSRLSALERRTNDTLDEVRRTLERPGYNERQKELLRKNIATNELTVRAIQLHKQLLEQQKNRALGTIKSLKADREVLRVTKLTLQNAAFVQELMHSSLQIISSLASLAMPDLQIYSDVGLRNEFDQVAVLLQQ